MLTSANNDGHVNNYVEVRSFPKIERLFVFGSLVDVILACVHLLLQVSSSDTSVEAMGLRKRLASKNVDLTKEERKMIRDFLESYNA